MIVFNSDVILFDGIIDNFYFGLLVFVQYSYKYEYQRVYVWFYVSYEVEYGGFYFGEVLGYGVGCDYGKVLVFDLMFDRCCGVIIVGVQKQVNFVVYVKLYGFFYIWKNESCWFLNMELKILKIELEIFKN